MRTFIWVAFIAQVVGIFLRFFIAATKGTPRTNTETIFSDLVYIMVGTGFAFWAGILLWG